MREQDEIGVIAAYYLIAGDEVAVMPLGYLREWAVLDILTIDYVDSNSIQLTNGRFYARNGGRGLTTSDYIVLATDEHHAALKVKTNERNRTRKTSGRSVAVVAS